MPAFEFSIASDGSLLGGVTYGICRLCRTGLVSKIGFPADWQFCGLGRLALSQLEARHPDLTWYTTGQFSHATGITTGTAWAAPADRQAAPLPAFRLAAKART